MVGSLNSLKEIALRFDFLVEKNLVMDLKKNGCRQEAERL
jgi:hypothetical protein